MTNLYTIVPLRAANARTSIEQSIGRGLRLPYGKRTGVTAVDRLTIVAHDRFQEIVDEANKPDSPIRLQAGHPDERANFSRRRSRSSHSRSSRRNSGSSLTGRHHRPQAASTRRSLFSTLMNRRSPRLLTTSFESSRQQPSRLPSVRPPSEARGAGRTASRGGEPVPACADGTGRRSQLSPTWRPLSRRPPKLLSSRPSTSRASSWFPRAR